MNSLQELNSFGNANVSYTDQSNFVIVIGTNAGNTLVTPPAVAANLVLPKQVPITTITDAVADIIIQYTANSTAAIAELDYLGPYSNIYVVQSAASTWQVQGIRSVNQYNEAFSNVKMTLTGNTLTTPFTIDTVVTDQFVNTETYTLTVDYPYIKPSAVAWFEDTAANIDIDVRDINQSGNTYQVTLTMSPTIGNLRLGNTSYGNTITLTANTQANINSQLDTLNFLPTAETSNANSTIYYTQIRQTDSLLQANAQPISLIGVGGNIPDPIIANTWSYDNVASSSNNHISNFSISQNITGHAGYPISTTNYSVSAGQVGNIYGSTVIPTITLTTMTAVGNNAILNVQGYFDSALTEIGNTSSWITSFPITTTASNAGLFPQTQMLTVNAYMLADTFGSVGQPTPGIGADHVLYPFTLEHYSSGVTDKFATTITLDLLDWLNVSGYSVIVEIAPGTITTNAAYTALTALAGGSALTAGSRTLVRAQDGTIYIPRIEGVTTNRATVDYPPQLISQNYTIRVRYGTGNPRPTGKVLFNKVNVAHGYYNLSSNGSSPGAIQFKMRLT